MPVLLLWQAWSWIGTFGNLLSKIPWQVWAAIGGVIAVLYYGHVRENRGYAKCEAAVVVATNKEKARQTQVADQALAASRERELAAQAKATEASDELDKLQRQVEGLKTSKTTCLPANITKQYRNR